MQLPLPLPPPLLTLFIGEVLALGIRPFSRIRFEFQLRHILDAKPIHIHGSELILIPRRAQIHIKSIRVVAAQLKDERRGWLFALIQARDALNAAQMIVCTAPIAVKDLRIQYMDG